ncbi:MGMT family protein [Paenibacillus sp. JCM 10914]|uniref:MGMT family protein n=1 Tax=Paenibacillus sp. JCM 10914 TaxID=1236974 RepID=UPI0003CCB376|nr:MGMT family protein [Paenibacillus sp. JCM 10914]GAE07294.1 hypothetical protein JCM10914_3515 [Paenibacillus sp. JCM 10914]
MLQPFTKRVIEVIRSIPEGHVMTYGQVARVAGSPRAARQVVRILHSMSQAHKLPWHRVVNAKGEIAVKDEETRLMQELYLQGEGVGVSGQGIINLNKYLYDPADSMGMDD